MKWETALLCLYFVGAAAWTVRRYGERLMAAVTEIDVSRARMAVTAGILPHSVLFACALRLDS